MSTSLKLKANGKLLLSGEYLVLDGAKALALPICFGQEMTVELTSEPILNWVSKENNKKWFKASFQLPNLDVINTSDTTIALELKKILQSAQTLSNDFLFTQSGYTVNIIANYPLKFGFGSSSTLISLIARWANVNEYTLFKMVSNGSGYDLACATQDSPIFYQLVDETPFVTKAELGEAIKKHCIFAYLGNKQNSKEEVERYKKYEKPSQKVIDKISELADMFCKASDALEIIKYINKHEAILSSILNRPVLAQQERFCDFKGAVKSLGAWGGYFAMFVSEKPISELREDLKQLGIITMFSYDELKIKA